MATFMAKATEIDRKWYIVDAANRPMGRTASEVAKILKGKHKPTYTPHVDCGDHVIVINVEKAILTGKKLTDKYYRHHTGWVGGLKEVQYATLMKENPEFAFERAVKGMLPATTLGRNAMTRLRVYKGSEHKHQAQKPEVYNID